MSSGSKEKNANVENLHAPVQNQPLDEASLIEERRKRREAIKAKHRGQATPLLVQALAINSDRIVVTPAPPVPRTASPLLGWFLNIYIMSP